MSQRVISNLSWNLSWPSENVRNINADYTYVPDSSDLAVKADLSFVNQKMNSIENNFKNRTVLLEKKIETSIDTIQNALNSKERIEGEKKEIHRLYDSLSKKINADLSQLSIRLHNEIKMYEEIEKSINERINQLEMKVDEYKKIRLTAEKYITIFEEKTKIFETTIAKLEQLDEELPQKMSKNCINSMIDFLKKLTL